MSMLLISSVLFGLFIIAVRLPLALAPAETLQFYKERVFGSRVGGRVFGAMMGALGVPMAVSAQGVEGTLPVFVGFFGMAFIFVMIVLMVVPGPFMRFAADVMDGLGARVMQVLGVLGVAFGVAWIYFSVVHLS